MAEEQSRHVEEDDELPEIKAGADGKSPLTLVKEIAKALREADGGVTGGDENTFQYPLSAALELFPRQYLKNVPADEITGEAIDVTIKDLFKQLARGKVEIPLSELAFFIPLHLIYSATLDDHGLVKLPLQNVVRAVGLQAFRNHIPQIMRVYDVSQFEDPFKEGEVSHQQEAALIIDEEEKPAKLTAKMLKHKHVKTEGEKAATHPPAKHKEAEKAKEVVEAPPPPEIPVARKHDESVPVAEEKPVAPPEQAGEAAPAPPAQLEEQPVQAAETQPPPGGPGTFEYPLAKLLESLPAEYLCSNALQAAGETSVIVELPDLFGQLRSGKVHMPLKELACALPAGLVTEQAKTDDKTVLKFQLEAVVKAVGTEVFKQQTPSALRQYDIERMADPFKEPEKLLKLDQIPRHAKGHAAPESADMVFEGAVMESSAAAAPHIVEYKAAAEPGSEIEYHELPGNVNVNAASAEELMMLPGVDREIADAIIRFRDEHDGFKSIFDLQKIHGIDETKFRKMTGMKGGPKHYHRRRRLAGLLGMQLARVSDLKLVAKALIGKAGFLGCVISDNDGLVLAQSGAVELGEGLSAVLPGIMGQMRHRMNLAGATKIGTVTMTVEDKIYAVSAVGNVVVTAVLAANMVSGTELSLIDKVTVELAWLMGLRAYVGPKI